MQKVANVSIMAMFVMYLLTAIFGYLTFYGKVNFSKIFHFIYIIHVNFIPFICLCVFVENVESELLEMYNKADTLMLCVRLAVLVAVTLTVPVVLFPVHTRDTLIDNHKLYMRTSFLIHVRL